MPQGLLVFWILGFWDHFVVSGTLGVNAILDAIVFSAYLLVEYSL